MEKVQDASNDIDIFSNDIDLYLQMYCEEMKIEDISTAPQNKWNGCLLYIQRHVFGDKSILKLSKPLQGYNNSSEQLIKSNCNAYDIELINKICDYYIYLCNVYDKEVSVKGFSKLTGINTENIYNWSDGSNKLSSSGYDIRKKLEEEREESLTAKLVSLKHPTGPAIILNKKYGYNVPGVSRETSGKPQASITDIQQRLLELSQSKPQLPDNGQ